jgi:hypothetical protein
MYNPMYYLSDYYDGYQTSKVARYWRIRTGIDQGDTALSTEVDLALAAENYSSAIHRWILQRYGDSDIRRQNVPVTLLRTFIEWVNSCLAE